MKLRYVEIEPSKIYNRLAPENLTCFQSVPQWHDTWFNDETTALRNQFAEIWKKEHDKIHPHFAPLEQSMKEKGMLIPVSLLSGPPRDQYLQNPNYDVTGHYPKKYCDDFDNMLSTHPFGGSRITIAERLGIESIPCAVYDFSNLFPEAPEITRDNYKDWFGGKYIFCNSLPYIRDGAMTNNNRTAQQEATRITKELMNV